MTWTCFKLRRQPISSLVTFPKVASDNTRARMEWITVGIIIVLIAFVVLLATKAPATDLPGPPKVCVLAVVTQSHVDSGVTHRERDCTKCRIQRSIINIWTKVPAYHWITYIHQNSVSSIALPAIMFLIHFYLRLLIVTFIIITMVLQIGLNSSFIIIIWGPSFIHLANCLINGTVDNIIVAADSFSILIQTDLVLPVLFFPFSSNDGCVSFCAGIISHQ